MAEAAPVDELDALRQELERVKAELSRASIEADEQIHDLTTKLAAVEGELSSAQTSATHASEREQKERERAQQLASELERFKAEQSKEQGATSEHKQREEQLQKEKRDLLATCEALETEKKDLQETIDNTRKAHSQLQAANSALEVNLQEATSTSRSALLKVQTLSSTVTSLEADKTFLSTELERTRTEASKYRREKQAIIIKLQSDLEASQLEERSAKTSLDALKAAHQSLSTRHADATQALAQAKEEIASNEASFRDEMSSMQRLVELMEKREQDRKQRIVQVEQALENERAALAEREDTLLAQIEKERERSDALEARCDELREALERSAFAPQPLSRAQSPAIGTPGPALALSPSAQLAVRGQKSGKSYAEIYSEYVRMQEDLAHERAESKRLGECLQQILRDIEERAPVLKEQRAEYERLSVEAAELAQQLALTSAERDEAALSAESYRLDVERLERESAVSSAQLGDLGRQVRSLMRSLARNEYDGIESRSSVEDEEEAAILKRLEETGTTDAAIDAHLVTFSTINELQVNNQRLLRVSRELGAQLEKNEETALVTRRGKEMAAVQEAHDVILQLKEEVESQRSKSEALIRERDMFRRLLAQRGETSAQAANGTNGATNGHASFAPASDSSRVLAEVQATFDAYRSEMAVDTQKLREDLAKAQREVGQARTELATAQARVDHYTDRFKQLQEDFVRVESERADAIKRSHENLGIIRRSELALNDATDKLIKVEGERDVLQHEVKLLRSEREVWKSVEARLTEDNAALSRERNHLGELMRNLQTMQNELERTGSDARRRLEEQVNRLEAQAADLRERLNLESDTARQATLRREVDGKNFQDRIDKLTAENADAREALATAKASQAHLEQRVADLTLSISAKEDKLAIYEGRRAGVSEADVTKTREQELEITVADLRNELRTAKSELERAHANVQQFQAIAETQGESLRDVTAAYDEYKTSTDASIKEKDSELGALRERLSAITDDVNQLHKQNSELHRQIAVQSEKFDLERKNLEDAMSGLRNADQVAREAQQAAKEDLERQAQLARDAHEKYERELVAHAEDVKRLSESKEEMDRVRAAAREYQTAAEVARANLATAEASWYKQKSVLEHELDDMRKRVEDLNKQNSALHEHLETFTNQAAELKSRMDAASSGSSGDGAAAPADMEAILASQSTSIEQLRDVIRYLRREKDIIDLQLEFGKQETSRLRQQLEFTNRNLEEARRALTDERQRSGETSISSAQHAELLERIHTAKLLRESNQTLRDENERAVGRISQLEASLRQAESDIVPLREQVVVLRAEVDAKNSQISLLEQDNDRWKARNASILQKYERIDPEELNALKRQVEELQTKLSEAEGAQQAGESNASSLRNQLEASRERFRQIQGTARDQREQLKAATTQVEELKQQLEEQTKQLAEKDQALAEQQQAAAAALANASQAGSTEATAELEQVKASLAAVEKERDERAERIKQLEEELATARAERETRVKELEAQLAAGSGDDEERTKLQEEVKRLQAQKEADDADLEKFKRREDQMKKDVRSWIQQAKEKDQVILSMKAEDEQAKQSAITTAVEERLASMPAADADTEEIVKQRVAAAEARLSAERDAAVTKAVEEATANFETELQKLRDQLAEAKTAAEAASAAQPAEGSLSKEEAESLRASFEETKKTMQADFDKIKADLEAESKNRIDEVTKTLNDELATLRSQAEAKGTSGDAPDIDALVAAKLAETEQERLASQQKAIDEAVAKALETAKADHTKALAEAKAAAEKEAAMKNSMLQKRVAALGKQVGDLKKAAQPAAEPATTEPPAATPPARPPRAGAGAKRSAPGSPSADSGSASAPEVPTLASIKGAASGRPKLPAGGVVGMLQRAQADAAAETKKAGVSSPKRPRESEDGNDLSKRMKGPK